MTKEQSLAISVIRCFSVSIIVLCHILQGMNSRLAWWFNVGVQILLFTSGFLYGSKVIKRVRPWLFQRAVRILAPFYILVFVYVIVGISFHFFHQSPWHTARSSVPYLFDLQQFRGGVPGLQHLWFLTTIALCYLITPFVQNVRFSNGCCNEKAYYCGLMLGAIASFIFFGVIHQAVLCILL